RDLNRLARSAEHDGWKLALVPFAAGDGARLMRIFMRPASPERAQDDGARFAVELDDSPYGSLQIDGLARPKRLDLALRTAREIPLAMRRELTAIFTASRSALALAGALAIQHRPDLASLATPAPSPGLII
ncbi:MAG: hypothetical protein ACKVSF_03950, partial [Alphaproteobacteria bacterium]